ncbi:hypothetical protein H4582DRAFT_2153353 [Lactarius indigo]|nr:hypothetical protein H4582DRAFT_2153353 [Lactarius indigo]
MYLFESHLIYWSDPSDRPQTTWSRLTDHRPPTIVDLGRSDLDNTAYARYYIATSTPLVWKDIATLLGKTLKRMGKIEDATPQSIFVADLPSGSAELPVFIGASQNVQGERAKALGWNPRHVALEKWVDEGVKVALEVLPKNQ